MTTVRIDQITTAYFNGLIVGRNEGSNRVTVTLHTGTGDTADSLADQIAGLRAQVAALCAQIDAMCGVPATSNHVEGGVHADTHADS
jgi:hypothetical protein